MTLEYIKNNDESITVEDVIYGTINVPYPFSKIIFTKEMQRLINISQNGFSALEYKELRKNNRLNHSIGAFHVMSLIINRLEEILKKYNIKINSDDKDIALCSMLLHDIGHGPFSHSFELITNYSHEKRTTDILLGETEVNKILIELFGKRKVKKIASFIAEINDDEDLGKDSFTKLLNNLVSYQLDADRIDYLIRDSYYIGYTSSIDLKRIIASLNVIVNNNQEYELLIDRKGLSSIENVLIQRYQMYRDVYLSKESVLGDDIFKKIIKRYTENKKLHSLPVSKYFKVLSKENSVTNLNDFINMIDAHFYESFEVLKSNNVDPTIAYLCDFEKMDDYLLIENDIPEEKVKTKLKEIFKNINLENTLSIINIKGKNRLYKKEQKLNIQNHNRIMDLTECTNLIQPQEILENKYLFFNQELLRLELGLSEKEFKKYKKELKKMIDELNKKPEEFELKYIINENEQIELNELIEVFEKNGFEKISIEKKRNIDEYYDTKDMDLYKNGGSLRIRKVTQNAKEEIKATFKMPTGEGEVYSSRTEIEETLPNNKFETFKQRMKELNIPIDIDKIIDIPVLNSTNDRTDVILSKNGIEVCLSLDNSYYTNHKLNNKKVNDKMIEIEAVGKINNRVILNEIHGFITSNFKNISINKQSKYERGITGTLK